MPPGPKKQSIKQKQYCNKFNKDLRKKKVTSPLDGHMSAALSLSHIPLLSDSGIR